MQACADSFNKYIGLFLPLGSRFINFLCYFLRKPAFSEAKVRVQSHESYLLSNNQNILLTKYRFIFISMRRTQNYGNHSQSNGLYYFLLIPLSVLFLALSIVFFIQTGFFNKFWLEALYYLLAGLVVITIVFLMRRQAMLYQKRIIRLEMRFRFYSLTGKPFNEYERKLTTKQLAALRFASDTELLSLLDIALQEKLPAAQIKKKIKYWKGDYYQV